MTDTILAVDPGRYKGVAWYFLPRDPGRRVPDGRHDPGDVARVPVRNLGALVMIGGCASAGRVRDRATAAGTA